LFLLFLLVAYFPVLLPFFHLKNDILTQNLPTRFVFAESLYSGYEPFWNPFLHYGNPQYGDMNNGFWNPVQWLIGATTGYNIYSITFEELFYILIGGWGMYKLSKEFFNKNIALITGLAYICCGYITGHLQYLCWITGTAYFPFVLLYFIRINKHPLIKNFLWGGIAVFLFVASTHPGLIIGAAYFFAFALLIIYFNRKGFAEELYHQKFWLMNLLFLFIGCALSLVVIVSNVDVLQYISRGDKVSLEQTLWAPTTIQSYISTLLPLPVHKSGFFNTDIGMRNVYIGLAHFVGLILLFRYANRKILLSIFIPLLFFILLSAGGYFKTIAWNFLPFIGYVRLNGEFTYFVILILLFAGAAGLSCSLSNNVDDRKKILSILKWCCLAIAVVVVLLSVTTRSSIVFVETIPGGSFKSNIKSVVDNLSIWDLFFLQAVIQLFCLYLLRKWIANKKRLLTILCLNLAIITWLTLPFTGLGMMSKKDVQSIINVFPRGISTQPLVAINEAEYISPADESQFLLIASYSKKIGNPQPDQYPVQLRSNVNFIRDTTLFRYINKQPFIFLSSDTVINSITNYDSATIHVIRSGPGYTKCIVKNDNSKWLTLLQNNYPYWEVKVDGNIVNHYTGFKTFISVPITAGEHTVEFSFEPRTIKTAMWVNLALLILSLTLLRTTGIANKRLFKR
ncbi:MAG TPA: YfhO family protein, partial [Chitinophagaceae bacterium]